MAVASWRVPGTLWVMTVVEARLKGAGMHWDRRHVNPMLALRTVACADRWDEAWPQILHHVRARRHRPPRLSARHVALVATTPLVLAPTIPPLLPRERLSYGPGRPAAGHPWKRPFLPVRSGRLALTSHQNAKR